MNEPVHLIEPTLQSPSGHCYALVQAICDGRAELGCPLHLWVGKQGRGLFDALPDAETTGYFTPRLRRLQGFWLLRQLLRQPGRLLLPTATTTDMLLIKLAAPRRLIEPDKVFLYVHWFRETPRKLAFLRDLAAKHPGLVMLTPTETVLELLQRAGFPHTRLVPYPLSDCAVTEADAAAAPYAGWLYPGAARVDKGFPQVADIIARLAADGATDPVLIHSIPPHNGRYQPEVSAALATMRAASYGPLTELQHSLNPAEFQRLFPGRITLQPYARDDFRDRISCVTLDALRAGSPIIAPADTWNARQALPFDAGIAVADVTADAFLEAARAIRDDFPRYQANALRAGAALRRRHDPRHMLRTVCLGLDAPALDPAADA